MQIHQFDDQDIKWRTLEGFDHFAYYIYDVDEKNETVDFV